MWISECERREKRIKKWKVLISIHRLIVGLNLWMAISNIWPPTIASNNSTHGNCLGDAWNGCETILKMIIKMASFDSFDNWMHYTILIMENVSSEVMINGLDGCDVLVFPLFVFRFLILSPFIILNNTLHPTKNPKF